MSCWTNKQIFFPINYLWKGKNVDMKRKEKGYQIGGWFGFVVLEKIGDRYNRGIKARSIELNGGNEAKLVSGSKEGSECVERHGEAAIRTVMMERKRPSQLWYGERHWDLCVNEKREKERKRLVILIEKGRRKQERERNEGDMGNAAVAVNHSHRDERGRPPIPNQLFLQILFFLLLFNHFNRHITSILYHLAPTKSHWNNR